MKYWMSYLAPSLGTVARLLRRRGIKVVAILDNVIPHEQKFFDKPFSRWFIKSCSSCLAMSEAVLSDMLSLAPDVPHILQAHPLYDHFGQKVPKASARERLSLDPSLKTLLFFGLIRDYKGLDLLIDAFSRLDSSYQLVIAGESYGSFEKYSAQIGALPPECASRIHVFQRYIGDEEVPVFFSAADVCVLPYRSATQSGITAISLHFDLPLVSTRVGGLAESIEKPGVGLMTSEISAQSIAACVSDFFAAPQETFAEAISRAKKEMSWSALAEALLSL